MISLFPRNFFPQAHPDDGDIRSGVQDGTLTLPAIGDVEASVQFGTGGTEFTGTFAVPSQGEVEDGVGYGEDGTEFLGTFDPVTGNYTDPGKANVLVGNDYEFAGVTQVAAFNELARNTDPGIVNVWNGINYKILNVAKTGTKRASSIANCVAANIKTGITIDDVTGTYAAVCDYPVEANVVKDVVYGLGAYTGTYGSSHTGAAEAGHSPAKIIAEMLIAATHFTDPDDGGTWPIYVSSLPDGTNVEDNAACVYDTAGVKLARRMETGENLFQYGFQIKFRAVGYADGWQKAQEVEKYLEEVHNEVVVVTVDDSYLLDSITLPGSIVSMGSEPGSERRELFTINGLLMMNPD